MSVSNPSPSNIISIGPNPQPTLLWLSLFGMIRVSYGIQTLNRDSSGNYLSSKLTLKLWSKQKKVEEAIALNKLELEIMYLIKNSTTAALSPEDETSLKALEQNRNSILLEDEKCWRLRSRATWLKWGDSNTKFFHKVANSTEIKSSSGRWNMTRRGPFADRRRSNLQRPHTLNNSTNPTESPTCRRKFQQPVSSPTLSLHLKRRIYTSRLPCQRLSKFFLSLKKKKVRAPTDGRPNFSYTFLILLDRIYYRWLRMCARKVKLSSSLNSTFLVLIPKKDHPSSFNDFRPISLCNLVYKLISKVISTRLKPVLERNLSPEQHGFLKGRRIHDAIGVAHECLHSISQKKQKALVMKIDLKKAFDSIDWNLLRLILLSVGFGIHFTNWIMTCVTSANLSVLINGEASRFFKCERGLRQGCPLSPYLFILVLEGLSLLLSKNVAEQPLHWYQDH
jgi:hypothetical protein